MTDICQMQSPATAALKNQSRYRRCHSVLSFYSAAFTAASCASDASFMALATASSS